VLRIFALQITKIIDTLNRRKLKSLYYKVVKLVIGDFGFSNRKMLVKIGAGGTDFAG
jgi:hypothetical protein